jgi:hypothetical protein
MKKLMTLALAIAVSGTFLTAKADSTQIDSSATSTSNNSGSATKNITSNPAWAAPIPGSNWVSFANTGNPSNAGFTVLPNGTNVTFSQTFDLSGTITSATLYVLADDTTTVVVNGTTIFAGALGGSYPTCSSVTVGCLVTTEGIFNIAPYLVDGVNTISFDVYQEAGSSYGLDYAAKIMTAPEPGVLLLLSSGLAGLGFLTSRRKLLN